MMAFPDAEHRARRQAVAYQRAAVARPRKRRPAARRSKSK